VVDGSESVAIATDSQPTCMASFNSLLVVGGVDKLVVIKDKERVGDIPIDYIASAAAFSPSGELAVGGQVYFLSFFLF
jgi:hypothetical protein